MFSYKDWLIEDLKRLPEDRERLEVSQNQLEREWLQRRIKDMERLLDQLTDLEREVILRLAVKHERATALANETGYNTKELYDIKDRALSTLLRLRY